MTTVLECLNGALDAAMESDPSIYLLGEDILDPYGGAFKVTRGLSEKFPDRVLTTPISEAAIVGIASGMAMRGLRPVVEIMFGDFITLCADQLVNHTSKFRWMYNDQVRVPIVVRSPMGGRRGYGPTHSQSLEKMFMGVPGLKVVAPNTLGDPAKLLTAAIADNDPVLFIEHKMLYNRSLQTPGVGDLIDFQLGGSDGCYPCHVLRSGANPQATIACYGYNFELVRAAALELQIEHEIFIEIIIFSQLSPFNLELLFQSLLKTRNLLTVEEGTSSMGWGAEIIARVAENMVGIKAKRIAALDLPIATSKNLEENILPSSKDIVNAAISLVT